MNASSLLGRLGGEDDARRTRNKRVMKGLANAYAKMEGKEASRRVPDVAGYRQSH